MFRHNYPNIISMFVYISPWNMLLTSHWSNIFRHTIFLMVKPSQIKIVRHIVLKLKSEFLIMSSHYYPIIIWLNPYCWCLNFIILSLVQEVQFLLSFQRKKIHRVPNLWRFNPHFSMVFSVFSRFFHGFLSPSHEFHGFGLPSGLHRPLLRPPPRRPPAPERHGPRHRRRGVCSWEAPRGSRSSPASWCHFYPGNWEWFIIVLPTLYVYVYIYIYSYIFIYLYIYIFIYLYMFNTLCSYEYVNAIYHICVLCIVKNSYSIMRKI